MRRKKAGKGYYAATSADGRAVGHDRSTPEPHDAQAA